jgi:N6-L-threonylcarbamoyladenine synthase
VHIIAQTIDDAAGAAVDKGAKFLGLKHPGGREIERFAAQGDAKRCKFPQVFKDSDEMFFSFSGLKTNLRYTLEKLNDKEFHRQFHDICASYQFAIVAMLIKKWNRFYCREFSKHRSIGRCFK